MVEFITFSNLLGSIAFYLSWTYLSSWQRYLAIYLIFTLDFNLFNIIVIGDKPTIWKWSWFICTWIIGFIIMNQIMYQSPFTSLTSRCLPGIILGFIMGYANRQKKEKESDE